LLTARLLARKGFEITLFERLDPTATYGFGVALAGRVAARLEPQDPEGAERIMRLCHPLRRWTMRRGSEVASIADRGAYGVERTALLQTLQELAVEAGARIVGNTEAHLQVVAPLGDAVVLADGVGSLGRQVLADRVGATVRSVPIPYIWCGAHLDLDGMTLDLQRTDRGLFCAHAMPYGGGACTFQVDTVLPTLEAAGFEPDVPGDDSDEEALRFLAGVFEPLLDGRRLNGNRSRWSTFRLVTCDRWSSDNVVLAGDAAHTAHYTVGSGTRMAMEDAISLSEAIAGAGSLDEALAAYEADRRPAVEHLQWRAARSQTWWRTLAHRYELPLDVLLLSYFTRTGSVGLGELSASNPGIVRSAVERLPHTRLPVAVTAGADGGEPAPSAGAASDAAERALRGRVLRAADVDGRVARIPCDGVVPWSSDPDVFARDADAGALLVGSGDRRRVLDRFDTAEQLLTTGRGPVGVAVPRELADDAATAVAARRVDYVVLEG